MSRLESHQLKLFSQLLSTKLTLAPKSTGKNVSVLTPHLLPLHLPVQMSGAPLPAASQGTMLHFSFPFPSHIYLPSKKILSAANSQHLLAEHTFKKKKKKTLKIPLEVVENMRMFCSQAYRGFKISVRRTSISHVRKD